jgi:hypothetical protein
VQHSSARTAEFNQCCRQIIREIGLQRYAAAVLDDVSAASAHLRALQRRIARDYVGPDCYWRPARSIAPFGVTTYFGRCWIVPFPFALLFVYDQAPTLISISEATDLELFVAQQAFEDVQLAKRVRLALRALDEQMVDAPYCESETSHGHSKISRMFRRGHEYALQSLVRYRRARLTIGRHAAICWRGYNHSSGFDLALSYADGCDSSGNVGRRAVLSNADLGVGDTFHLSPQLARLLHDNRDLIERRLPLIEAAIADYRTHYRSEAAWKRQTLSYAFLLNVVGEDSLAPTELAEVLMATEANPLIRQLPTRYPSSFNALHERTRAVNRSRLTQWWCVTRVRLLADDG